MKVCIAQTDIVWEDKEKNMKAADKFIDEAVKNSSDYIVFPEMSLTGFSTNTKLIEEQLSCSPTIDFFKKQASEKNIAVSFGVVLKNDNEPEKPLNCHCIVNRNGELVAAYSKIHLFSYGVETQYYSSGRDIAFCELDGIPISPFVCYDLRFPEIFQSCSNRSKVITVIANWGMKRREHWIVFLKARAIENQCFVIGVNRAGSGGGVNYTGDSMVINPQGKLISDTSDKECLIYADIDIAEADSYRKKFELKADRKNDLYVELYNSYLK